jgi:hypothetical protein
MKFFESAEHPDRSILVLLTIHVPKGANALYLTKNLSHYPQERELLIMHDQRLQLRPNGAKYERDGDVLCLEINLIPQRIY